MKRFMINISVLGLLLLWIATGVSAFQEGMLEGTIQDQSGISLPGATVYLISDTGVQKHKITDTDGRYKFSDLVPGKYRIKIEMAGFSTVKKNIRIDPGKTTAQNVNLNFKTESERVVVTGKARVVDAPKTSPSFKINKDVVKQLVEADKSKFTLHMMPEGAEEPSELPTIDESFQVIMNTGMDRGFFHQTDMANDIETFSVVKGNLEDISAGQILDGLKSMIPKRKNKEMWSRFTENKDEITYSSLGIGDWTHAVKGFNQKKMYRKKPLVSSLFPGGKFAYINWTGPDGLVTSLMDVTSNPPRVVASGVNCLNSPNESSMYTNKDGSANVAFRTNGNNLRVVKFKRDGDKLVRKYRNEVAYNIPEFGFDIVPVDYEGLELLLYTSKGIFSGSKFKMQVLRNGKKLTTVDLANKVCANYILGFYGQGQAHILFFNKDDPGWEMTHVNLSPLVGDEVGPQLPGGVEF